MPQIGAEKAVRQTEMTFEDGRENAKTASGIGAVVTQKSNKAKAGLEVTIEDAEMHPQVPAAVYACADKLGIEELKEYACSHFVDLAEDNQMKLHHLSSYGQLLEYLYDNTILESAEAQGKGPGLTIHTTSGLRFTATMCAVQNLHTTSVADKIRRAIKEHEPMAWEVAGALRDKRIELSQVESFLERTRRNLDNANVLVHMKGAGEMSYAKRIAGKL